MFNNYPFGFSNFGGNLGGYPFGGFNNFGGGNNWCGPNCSPMSGWNNWNSFGNGFNNFGGFNNWNNWSNFANGFNNCTPYGWNNWNSYGVPFNGFGFNNWNSLNYSGMFNAPLSGGFPYAGAGMSMGFPGMNWNNAWNGFSSPSMNWNGCFPGNFSNGSPVAGVSNWFSSPWMGYAYPGYSQNNNAGSNGAFPFPCAPFNVPFQSNGYAPAGQGVNCEAA